MILLCNFQDGTTLFMSAAELGLIRLVEYLTWRGVDVGRRDSVSWCDDFHISFCRLTNHAP